MNSQTQIRGDAKSTLSSNLRSLTGRLFFFSTQNPLLAIGIFIVATAIFVAAFSGLLATHDVQQIDLSNRLSPPSPENLMGTDELGRDIYSRVVVGASISIPLGISIVAAVASIGVVIGCFSTTVGGPLDFMIMRITDVVISIPGLVLAMALAAALGPSLSNVVIALAIVRAPHYVRLARGQALVVRSNAYVEASKAGGANIWHRMRYHIIPNSITPVLIQATSDIGGVILAASSLSFIGLGAQPPTPEWGAMVSVGRQYFLSQWWYATFPALSILLTALGFNLLGDGLRDAVDPRH